MSLAYKSFFSGLLIAIGGLCYLNIENHIIGAFLFSIGLLTIFYLKLNLFTGWVCQLDKYADPLEMLCVLLCNMFGASMIGILTTIYNVDAAKEVWEAKLDKHWMIWVLSSIVCGMFIAIAVYGFQKTKSNLIVVLAVMGFILTGSEHCIADTFYWINSMIPDETAFESIIRILVCVLGNLIGGVFIGGLMYCIDVEENR